jgi:hypothetical protein
LAAARRHRLTAGRPQVPHGGVELLNLRKARLLASVVKRIVRHQHWRRARRKLETRAPDPPRGAAVKLQCELRLALLIVRGARQGGGGVEGGRASSIQGISTRGRSPDRLRLLARPALCRVQAVRSEARAVQGAPCVLRPVRSSRSAWSLFGLLTRLPPHPPLLFSNAPVYPKMNCWSQTRRYYIPVHVHNNLSCYNLSDKISRYNFPVLVPVESYLSDLLIIDQVSLRPIAISHFLQSNLSSFCFFHFITSVLLLLNP